MTESCATCRQQQAMKEAPAVTAFGQIPVHMCERAEGIGIGPCPCGCKLDAVGRTLLESQSDPS